MLWQEVTKVPGRQINGKIKGRSSFPSRLCIYRWQQQILHMGSGNAGSSGGSSAFPLLKHWDLLASQPEREGLESLLPGNK